MRYASWHDSEVRIPPDRMVKLIPMPITGVTVELCDTSARMCTKCGVVECGCLITKESFACDVSTDDPRLACVVAYLADLFHEALEWFTIDGVPYADPHAPGAQFGVEWTVDQLRQLVVQYGERWG